jgi:ribonuclease HI
VLEEMLNDELLVCPFDNTVVAFVDGSAFHNGFDDAVAAYAVVICHTYENFSISGLVPVGKHTNQRAELTALCKLLEYATSLEFAQVAQVTSKLIIVYDSAYAWGAITTWYENWKKDGTKVMATKMNIDLIENGADAYKRLKQVREVEGIHIKSHQREEPQDHIQFFYWYGNGIVDSMARKLVDDAKAARSASKK